jgi:hypothetical protein
MIGFISFISPIFFRELTDWKRQSSHLTCACFDVRFPSSWGCGPMAMVTVAAQKPRLFLGLCAYALRLFAEALFSDSYELSPVFACFAEGNEYQATDRFKAAYFK